MNIELIKEKVLQALRIRDEIHKIYEKHEVQTNLCKEDISPYYNQIDESSDCFLCEYYYDSPSKIFTPLGYLRVTASYMVMNKNAEKAIKEIEDTFGFKLEKEEVKNSIGVFGGWYYITKLPWSNEELESNCSRREHNTYIDYDTANKLFAEIKTEYEKGQTN